MKKTTAMATGPWLCSTCTLQNINPTGLACELCGTERSWRSKKMLRNESVFQCQNKKGTEPDDSSKEKATKVIYLEGSSEGSESEHDYDPLANEDTSFSHDRRIGANEITVAQSPHNSLLSPVRNPYKRSKCQNRPPTLSIGMAADVVPVVSHDIQTSANEDTVGQNPGNSHFLTVRNPYKRRRVHSQNSTHVPPVFPNEFAVYANATLRRYWGNPSLTLRPFQLATIEALRNGRDALVISGTGSGKSVCYQLPPLLSSQSNNSAFCSSITIVVSPLISLMRDQCASLQKKGIRAEYLGSGQDDPNSETRAMRGEAMVVFCCPESLTRLGPGIGRLYDRLLQGQNFNHAPILLAVDECHCVSKWGHDFRKEYQKIGEFRSKFLPNAPCVALTATATRRVKEDVCKSLRLGPNHHVSTESFDRPNLHYTANHCNDKGTAVSALIKIMQPVIIRQRSALEPSPQGTTIGPSAIVYCTTRKDCELLALDLDKALKRAVGWRPGAVAVEAYHAGLTPKTRIAVQDRWTRGQTIAVCATIAFGMGIDKPNVR